MNGELFREFGEFCIYLYKLSQIFAKYSIYMYQIFNTYSGVSVYETYNTSAAGNWEMGNDGKSF